MHEILLPNLRISFTAQFLHPLPPSLIYLSPFLFLPLSSFLSPCHPSFSSLPPASLPLLPLSCFPPSSFPLLTPLLYFFSFPSSPLSFPSPSPSLSSPPLLTSLPPLSSLSPPSSVPPLPHQLNLLWWS